MTRPTFQPMQAKPPITAVIYTWYHGLPMCTKSIFTLIVSVYVLRYVTGSKDTLSYCLSPVDVVVRSEVFRICSSAIVHQGPLQLAFNMMSFISLGTSLESRVGTIQFALLTLLNTFLTAVVYTIAAYVLYATDAYPAIMQQCAVGFAGVNFANVVIENSWVTAQTRSVYGIFMVPVHLYPLVLLMLEQFLMPKASFLGRLSGLLVGQLWVMGYLKALRLPFTKAANCLEKSHTVSHRLAASSSFVAMPIADVLLEDSLS